MKVTVMNIHVQGTTGVEVPVSVFTTLTSVTVFTIVLNSTTNDSAPFPAHNMLVPVVVLSSHVGQRSILVTFPQLNTSMLLDQESN